MNRKIPPLAAATALALVFAATSAPAQEAVVTLRATVTGNQEQPKVMYLVPWQQRESADYEYAPDSGLAQDLFMQVDRAEFVRELNYRALLASPAAQTSGSD